MSYTDRDKYGMYKDSRHAGPGPALMGAHTLIGDGVVNAAEEDLGDIKEIMLDMQTGQVAYAVLSFGGFLGVGEKLFAVPWQALHLDTVNHRFVLDVDKERLQTAPGFDADAWPNMADLNWASGVHSFYGTDPDRQGPPSMGPVAPMGGLVGGSSAGTGSRMGSGMGSSMGAGSAGGGDLGSGSGLGGAGSSLGTGAGGGSSNLGGSAGSGTAAGTGAGGSSLGSGAGGSGTEYGKSGSADPRPDNLGDDKNLSHIRGSNIG